MKKTENIKFITIINIIKVIFVVLFFLAVAPTQASAANRYWVPGGDGNWSSSTNWSTTSGGASGAAAPTYSDAVIFDGNSGSGTATVNTAALATSLDFTNFTGTLAGSASLNLDFNLPAGNITFGAGMTVTYTGDINIYATSGTTTLTTNGKALKKINHSGPGGSLSLADDLTIGSSSFITVSGTFNTNNHNMSVGDFTASTANTHTLTLGSSTITVTNGGYTTLNNATTTNETITPNTATITLTGSYASLSPGSINWNGTSIIVSPTTYGTASMSNSPTFANITLNGPTSVSQAQVYSFTAGSTWTVTGTATMAGNNVSNRIKVSSATRGTSATISAGTWTVSNTDFEDINVAGGSFDGSSGIGDLGGNSGNFAGRTATTYYWVADTGSYSDTTKWSASSGGAAANTIPLPQDTARFDANSFTGGSKQVTLDESRMGSLDWTGVTNNPYAYWTQTNTTYGSLLFNTSMSTSNGYAINMASRGTSTLTSSASMPGITITTITGTVNLQSSYTSLGNYLTLTSGTFNTNNYNMTFNTSAGGMYDNGSTSTRVLNLGSSTITINSANATTNAWNFNSTGLTFNAGTSTIKMTLAGSKTFSGGGLTYYNVQDTNTGGGQLTIQGSNTFRSLSSTGSAKTIKFTAGTTQTITSKNGFITGSSGVVQTLQSTSDGSAWTVSSNYDQDLDYLSIQDSTASEPSRWYAGYNSTNVSGNTKWTFTGLGYSIRPPIAYWPLDDGTGTTAQDSTTNNLDGTLNNTPAWQTEDMCIAGKCLYFDGTNNENVSKSGRYPLN